MEYQINDTVMYGADGVCIISEITERKIGTEIHKYYILKPVYDNKSTIMVPFANEHLVGKMKELLNGDEIRLALETAQKAEFDNVEDDSLQKEAFHNAIDNSDLLGLLRLTKALYERRKIQEEKGKRLQGKSRIKRKRPAGTLRRAVLSSTGAGAPQGSPLRGRFPLSGGNVPKGQKG